MDMSIFNQGNSKTNNKKIKFEILISFFEKRYALQSGILIDNESAGDNYNMGRNLVNEKFLFLKT